MPPNASPIMPRKKAKRFRLSLEDKAIPTGSAEPPYVGKRARKTKRIESEMLFQGTTLSTMMFDDLDVEGHKRALTVSADRGTMRISRRSRCDWACCAVCSQEEYEHDRRLCGWQIGFPALGALRLHREIFRKAGDVPLLDFPVSVSQRKPLSRELIAIKCIARRWWRANIRRIRKTRGHGMSETLWQMRYIQQSLERSEGDKGWRLTDGEWSQVLRPLLIAKEDIIITGGLMHLLRIFEIAFAEREASRHSSAKRQRVVDYLTAHPQCGIGEIVDACRVSRSYAYYVIRNLRGETAEE